MHKENVLVWRKAVEYLKCQVRQMEVNESKWKGVSEDMIKPTATRNTIFYTHTLI